MAIQVPKKELTQHGSTPTDPNNPHSVIGVYASARRRKATIIDMVAVFLTGIAAGIVPGFSTLSGSTLADLLRLNLAIPPAKSPSIFGVLGGDLAGFPNGRRVADDVFTIELRALAGATIPTGRSSIRSGPARSRLHGWRDPGEHQFALLIQLSLSWGCHTTALTIRAEC